MLKLRIQTTGKNKEGVSVVKREDVIEFSELPVSVELEVIAHIIKNATGLRDKLRDVAEGRYP